VHTYNPVPKALTYSSTGWAHTYESLSFSLGAIDYSVGTKSSPSSRLKSKWSGIISFRGYYCNIFESCNPYFFMIRAFARLAIVCILRLHSRPKVIPQYVVHRCSFVKFYIMSTFRMENSVTLKTMSNILKNVTVLNTKTIYAVNEFSTKRTFWCFENKRIDSEPSANRTC